MIRGASVFSVLGSKDVSDPKEAKDGFRISEAVTAATSTSA
jgi:hypothetical protein